MPFKSNSQRAWAMSTHQPWAEKWNKMTKGPLPPKVKKVAKKVKKVVRKAKKKK